MDNSNIKLLYGVKEWSLFISTLTAILCFNLLLEYHQFKRFKTNEIYAVQGYVENIYPKEDFNTIKLQTPDFHFFTSSSKYIILKRFEQVQVMILTSKVDFWDYLRGFYASSINIYTTHSPKRLKEKLSFGVASQHDHELFKELYNALFFAIPVSKHLREVCTYFGISHLIAISGFHLGLLSFILYWIFYAPYTYVHRKYFPYRNKKYDILLLCTFFLLSYLIFTSLIPSLLRAFVMFVLGIIFLRSNIKILSFETLFITTLLIVAFFPKYIFSLSLWFSISGVFYIFLFLKYFNKISKIGQFALFNCWIYLAMNPITHYFFGTISYLQLFSPLITVLFTLFYPLELLLHLIGYGGIFDDYLLQVVQLKPYASELFTPLWFLFIYGAISLLSPLRKEAFIVLNILLVLFNGYIFYLNSGYWSW
ncbi:MAG: ComEC/Rec2 family competence protein [Candidatus Marinarcus sp.]|uniref:ComEC/Rec2 family competence protein n=1 Tax=Candidatus Marinarcus sp. TaxID=3100987 RepID=UPI003B00CF33